MNRVYCCFHFRLPSFWCLEKVHGAYTKARLGYENKNVTTSHISTIKGSYFGSIVQNNDAHLLMRVELLCRHSITHPTPIVLFINFNATRKTPPHKYNRTNSRGTRIKSVFLSDEIRLNSSSSSSKLPLHPPIINVDVMLYYLEKTSVYRFGNSYSFEGNSRRSEREGDWVSLIGVYH